MNFFKSIIIGYQMTKNLILLTVLLALSVNAQSYEAKDFLNPVKNLISLSTSNISFKENTNICGDISTDSWDYQYCFDGGRYGVFRIKDIKQNPEDNVKIIVEKFGIKPGYILAVDKEYNEKIVWKGSLRELTKSVRIQNTPDPELTENSFRGGCYNCAIYITVRGKYNALGWYHGKTTTYIESNNNYKVSEYDSKQWLLNESNCAYTSMGVIFKLTHKEGYNFMNVNILSDGFIKSVSYEKPDEYSDRCYQKKTI